MGFVADEVALEQLLPPVLGTPLTVSIYQCLALPHPSSADKQWTP